MSGIRLDMATLVGTLSNLDDKIQDDESVRQDILEVAAACFRMLELIGDHPLNRIARELDITRAVANEFALLSAAHRNHEPMVFIAGVDDDVRGRIRKRIAQILVVGQFDLEDFSS